MLASKKSATLMARGLIAKTAPALLAALLLGSLTVAPTALGRDLAPLRGENLNQRLAEIGATTKSSLSSPVGDSVVNVVVLFERDQARPEFLSSNTKDKSLHLQRQRVVRDLSAYFSSAEEQTLHQALAIEGVTLKRRFWILRGAEIQTTLTALTELCAVPGISQIIENISLESIESVEYSPAGQLEQLGPSQQLQSMNIPALWSQGLTGAGRVVASFDTGVEGVHPALADKFHGHNIGFANAFFAPNSTDTVPFDNIGHGTHTMGVMVGNNEADSFGVAPGAFWMNAAVIDQGNSLNGTLADIIAAFQWTLNPDDDVNTTNDIPDVILNSWGIPVGLFGPCDDTFWEVIDNCEAAGIVTIFAVGNEGPNPYTVRSPANRISSPLNAFSVGAIDHGNNLVADFSSRGPSTCDSATVKPEVVAPGVLVYSSNKGGTYGFRSGTSMAAPYIAGMVALFRQYNPDVSVQQIKQAILGSAVDLGESGNDNSYGHGLPDALRALQLLPAPEMPSVTVVATTNRAAEYILPGDVAQIVITLQAPIGAYDSLYGSLRTVSVGNSRIISDTATFYFSPATGTGINIRPFEIYIDDDLQHGATIDFTLDYSKVSGGSASIPVSVTVGVEPAGALYTHRNSDLNLTVTDFGKFGLAPGSAYPASGDGFKWRGGENLLYESGITLARSELQLSSSIRDSLAQSFTSDYKPELVLSSLTTGADELVSMSVYRDTNPLTSISLDIIQRVTTLADPLDQGFAIVEFTLFNYGLEPLTGVRFGFFSDFDLNMYDASDEIGYEPGLNMFYQQTNGVAVGVIALSELSGAFVRENDLGKTAFSEALKYSALLVDSIEIPSGSLAADYYQQLNFGTFSLQPFDSQVIALALVAGDDALELFENAERARSHYLTPTGVDDDLIISDATLPESYRLEQNYPNPFNPSTTIAYSLPRAGEVSLVVYNTLGQRVRMLLSGRQSAGENKVVWDGTDDSGRQVASGMYLYRLVTSETVINRKMVFLK
ncbi:S8 family serine peptidase [Gemmatimonas aurantiaca]|nr:S8 family serine peptidase [Gemmatimonas aurantiaca]